MREGAPWCGAERAGHRVVRLEASLVVCDIGRAGAGPSCTLAVA